MSHPSRRATCSRVHLLVLAGSLVASSVSGDWLSLSDGGLIQTKGAWKEKGKTVVYTAMTGELASLRLSEVDLAMSRALGKRLQTLSYVDLGANADPTDPLEAPSATVADARQAAEAEHLRQFVRDPNAPKTSGTLSASSDEAALKNLDAQIHQHPRYASEFCEIFEGTVQSACLIRAELASELLREEFEHLLANAAADAEQEGEENDSKVPEPAPR